MTRILSLVLAVLLFAGSAFASSGLVPDAMTGGGSRDWIDRGNGAESIAQLAVAFSYDIVLAEDGTFGLSFWQLVSAAPGSDGANESDWITESSVGWWREWFDFNLETMVGGSFVVWGSAITGREEVLGGPLLALRAPVEWSDPDADGLVTPTVWMEARTKFYLGTDGRRQYGINFGPVFKVGG